VGAMSRLWLAGFDDDRAVMATDALLASQYEERLGARMAVNRGNAAGRATGLVDAKEILLRSDARYRPDLGHLDAATRRDPCSAEREQPDLPVGFRHERPRASCRLRVCPSRVGLYPPIEFSRRQPGHLSLSQRRDDERLLCVCD